MFLYVSKLYCPGDISPGYTYVSAKFQLPILSRSGSKVCGGGVVLGRLAVSFVSNLN